MNSEPLEQLNDFQLLFKYVINNNQLEFLAKIINKSTEDDMLIRMKERERNYIVELIDRGIKIPDPGSNAYNIFLEIDQGMTKEVSEERRMNNHQPEIERFLFLIEWRTPILQVSGEVLKNRKDYQFQHGVVPANLVEDALEIAERFEKKGFEVEILDRDNVKTEIDREHYEIMLEKYYEDIKGIDLE